MGEVEAAVEVSMGEALVLDSVAEVPGVINLLYLRTVDEDVAGDLGACCVSTFGGALYRLRGRVAGNGAGDAWGLWGLTYSFRDRKGRGLFHVGKQRTWIGQR